MRAAVGSGLCTVNERAAKPVSSPSAPPPPGTGHTLRCARLLSKGTSRHSAVGPVAQGKNVAGSMLLRSPLALTSMNMHSWPTVSGTQANGPTTVAPPEGCCPGR